MIQFYTWGAPVEKWGALLVLWGAFDMTRIILFLAIFRTNFEECLRMLAQIRQSIWSRVQESNLFWFKSTLR